MTTPRMAAYLAHMADPAGAGIADAELLRRFAESRDEAAFELLVWRHGGLVLGACRRVLGPSADADDAFQAAFLALARQAKSVRRGDAVAAWLHRVAVRAATRLRTAAARRRAVPLPDVAAPPAPLFDDTAAVLDEEIARLPDKLRVVFVLCELDGRTDAEAAAHLGCPKGTVLSRLSRARERLRQRLRGRGLAPAVAVAPSAGLIAETVRAGVGFATGTATGPVVMLAAGVLRAQALSAWRPVAAGLALALAAAVTVGGAVAGRPAGLPPVPTPPPGLAVAAVPVPGPRAFKLATADEGQVQVERARFSPDGRWVVTRGSKTTGRWVDHAVVVWDAATGARAHAFPRSADFGAGTTFSPDGKLLAVASGGSDPATLYAAGTWRAGRTFRHLFAADVAFSPDGRRVVTRSVGWFQSNLSEVRGWDAAAGEPAWALLPQGREQFVSAAFAPDGKTVAVGSSLGTTRLLDAATGQVRAELKVREQADNEAAFSPDGRWVLTWTTGFEPVKGEATGGVRLWDAATGKAVRTFGPNDVPVVAAGFAPGGRVVAASASGGVVWAWEAATGKPAATWKVSDAPFAQSAGLALSPDGKLVAVSGWEGKAGRERRVATLFDLAAGKERARLPDVQGVAFNHDGAVAAVVTAAGPADEVTVCPVSDLLNR